MVGGAAGQGDRGYGAGMTGGAIVVGLRVAGVGAEGGAMAIGDAGGGAATDEEAMVGDMAVGFVGVAVDAGDLCPVSCFEYLALGNGVGDGVEGRVDGDDGAVGPCRVVAGTA